mgnify:FL=1
MCRTVEDCAMVFSVLHGVDEKDSSTVTMPFQFDRNLKLASLRIGVDPAAPKELVDKLRELGMNPKAIGARPTVAGGQGALGVESAAAFDFFVQRKAKEMGLDLNTIFDTPRTGNAPFGNHVGSLPKGVEAGATNPMAGADWNPRFVGARASRGFEFMQGQRRRMLLVAKWGEFMKELDLFIAGPNADVGANAQTGHPCTVLPYKFDVPQFGGGGGGGGANAATPAPVYKAQPICGVITGNLYHDDLILSVAHQFQKATDHHTKRPALG